MSFIDIVQIIVKLQGYVIILIIMHTQSYYVIMYILLWLQQQMWDTNFSNMFTIQSTIIIMFLDFEMLN